MVLFGKMIADGGRTLLPFPRPAEFPLSIINAPFLLGVLVYLANERLTRFRLASLFLAASRSPVGRCSSGRLRGGDAVASRGHRTRGAVLASGPQQESVNASSAPATGPTASTCRTSRS